MNVLQEQIKEDKIVHENDLSEENLKELKVKS